MTHQLKLEKIHLALMLPVVKTLLRFCPSDYRFNLQLLNGGERTLRFRGKRMETHICRYSRSKGTSAAISHKHFTKMTKDGFAVHIHFTYVTFI